MLIKIKRNVEKRVQLRDIPCGSCFIHMEKPSAKDIDCVYLSYADTHIEPSSLFCRCINLKYGIVYLFPWDMMVSPVSADVIIEKEYSNVGAPCD